MNTGKTKKRSERNSRESILPPKHQEIPKNWTGNQISK
jgi:hypothetical protein